MRNRVSTVNRLTGYDGYRILTSSNRLENFNHGYNRLWKFEKCGCFSSDFFVFGATYSAFDVSKKPSFDSCLQKWVKAEEVCKKMDMITIHK